MSIHVQCQCGATYKLKDHLAGKRVRCKACNQPLVVPNKSPNRTGANSTASAKASTGKKLPVICECAHVFEVLVADIEKQVNCPKCNQLLQFPPEFIEAHRPKPESQSGSNQPTAKPNAEDPLGVPVTGDALTTSIAEAAANIQQSVGATVAGRGIVNQTVVGQPMPGESQQGIAAAIPTLDVAQQPTSPTVPNISSQSAAMDPNVGYQQNALPAATNSDIASLRKLSTSYLIAAAGLVASLIFALGALGVGISKFGFQGLMASEAILELTGGSILSFALLILLTIGDIVVLIARGMAIFVPPTLSKTRWISIPMTFFTLMLIPVGFVGILVTYIFNDGGGYLIAASSVVLLTIGRFFLLALHVGFTMFVFSKLGYPDLKGKSLKTLIQLGAWIVISLILVGVYVYVIGGLSPELMLSASVIVVVAPLLLGIFLIVHSVMLFLQSSKRLQTLPAADAIAPTVTQKRMKIAISAVAVLVLLGVIGGAVFTISGGSLSFAPARDNFRTIGKKVSTHTDGISSAAGNYLFTYGNDFKAMDGSTEGSLGGGDRFQTNHEGTLGAYVTQRGVRVFTIPENSQVQLIPNPEVESITFSEDSKRLGTFGSGKASIYDLKSGKMIHEYEVKELRDVRWVENLKIIVGTKSNRMRYRLDPTTGAEIECKAEGYPFPDFNHSLSYKTQGGKTIVSVLDSQSNLVSQVEVSDKVQYRAIKFSRDGTRIVIQELGPKLSFEEAKANKAINEEFHVFDFKDGKLSRVGIVRPRLKGQFREIVLSPNGRFLVLSRRIPGGTSIEIDFEQTVWSLP